jgi:hypothetical protein
MQLVICDAEGSPVRSTSDYTLDLQYGDGACDFSLDVGGTPLAPGWRVACDGTPFGGVVDTLCVSHLESGDSRRYKGRSVQGVLAGKVVLPPDGADHLVLSGDANVVIAGVVARVGLSGYLSVPTTPSGIEVSGYRFHRYVDAYTGLRMAMASAGARLRFCHSDDGWVVSAVPSGLYGQVESERVYFSLESAMRPVNHLVGLGKGEGADRAVSHWYADASGAVSQTQTLKGVDEVALAYELTSEEADTLPAKTRLKLIEYQEASEADITLPPGADLDVGDSVVLSSASCNVSAAAQVVGVVLKASGGVAKVDYRFGIPDYPDDGK